MLGLLSLAGCYISITVCPCRYRVARRRHSELRIIFAFPLPDYIGYCRPNLHILKCSDFNSLYCAKKNSSLATEFKLSNSEILNISLALNSVSPVSFFAKPYGVNPKFSAIKLFFKPLFFTAAFSFS
nr:MAG TPA: hypothetical protein [Caudoviricetes sp.]